MELKKFCELLSEYFDHDPESDFCTEIEKLIEEDPYYENIFNTLNKTIELFDELESEELEVPEETHTMLFESIRIEIRKINKP